MKRLFLFLLVVFTLVACRKDKVDATSTLTLQSSINDMAAGLTTLQQIKFSEALYILKTFGVEAEGDVNELRALGKLINGMKVPQIFALADQVATKNGIEWSSTGPPSLGQMNIFGTESAQETDPNDIAASSLSLETLTVGNDSILGPKALQVIPRLVDNAGRKTEFSGAALETVMEVYSNGVKLLTSKNLMQDSNFKGFNLRFASLPATKIVDNSIDITVSVKTTKKTFKMSKIGLKVNPKTLLMPSVTPAENVETTTPSPEGATGENAAENTSPAQMSQPATTTPGDPKASVSKFLSNLNSQNFKAAFDTSDNPAWSSYENFSNTASGFGAVKSINVKNLTTNSASATAASVGAVYDVTDKSGKTTALQVTFALKNVNGQWKISGYKIN